MWEYHTITEKKSCLFYRMDGVPNNIPYPFNYIHFVTTTDLQLRGRFFKYTTLEGVTLP